MSTPSGPQSTGRDTLAHFTTDRPVAVLMIFVDGDPDRPLIVGAVPNPVTPSPVDSSNSTKNRIKTESGMLLEFDDGAGS